MKDDYSYWSENLHSAYLFYTLEVDKLNRENKRLREALGQIANQKIGSEFDNLCNLKLDNCTNDCKNCLKKLAKQALGE